jgi:hypothetical protein
VTTLQGQTAPIAQLVLGQFKDARNREVALPLSFRGLTPALAALAKEQ